MRSAVLRLANGPWPEPAGVALVLVLVVAGSVVEAYPSHHYAGLHLRTHPNPAAFALVAVPALLLWWRRSHPAAVYLAAVAGIGRVGGDGPGLRRRLVVVLVALYSLAVAGSGRIALAVLGAGGALTIWLVGGLLGPWGWWGGPQLDMWPEMLAAAAVGAAVVGSTAMEGERASAVCATRASTGGGDPPAGGLRAAPHREGAARRRGSLHRHDQRAGQCGGDPAPRDPARVAEALQAIRDASKNGLRELRSILDVLRQVDGGQPAVPLPDRDAFQALADAATAAGIVTRLRCDARPRRSSS